MNIAIQSTRPHQIYPHSSTSPLTPNTIFPPRSRFRDQLEAGPGAINLRERSPFYYEIGVALASMMGDERLQDTLLMAFSGERFKRLLDCSLNSLNEDANTFTRDLPNLEKDLFTAGYQSSEEYVDWKSRAFNKLATSKVIKNKVKRRRISGP